MGRPAKNIGRIHTKIQHICIQTKAQYSHIKTLHDCSHPTNMPETAYKTIEYRFTTKSEQFKNECKHLNVKDKFKTTMLLYGRKIVRKYCRKYIVNGPKIDAKSFTETLVFLNKYNLVEKIWPNGFDKEEILMCKSNDYGFIMVTTYFNGFCIHDNTIHWFRYNTPVIATFMEPYAAEVNDPEQDIHISTMLVIAVGKRYNETITRWAVECINRMGWSKIVKYSNINSLFAEHTLDAAQQYFNSMIDPLAATVSVQLESKIHLRTTIHIPDPKYLTTYNVDVQRAVKNRCQGYITSGLSSKKILIGEAKMPRGRTIRYHRSARDLAAIDSLKEYMMYVLMCNAFDETTMDYLALFMEHKLPQTRKL